MAKTLKESPVTTRNARAKLPEGLHWRGLDPDVHLGYRKGKRGGVWLVRWRAGAGYRQAPVGTADDTISEGTYDFEAAQRLARQIVETARREAAAAAAGPVATVHSAVLAYIQARDARDSRRAGRQVASDASARLRRYVTGREASGTRAAIPAAPIASMELHRLSENDLADWRQHLPEDMKASGRQRLINDIKAALNAAYGQHKAALPADFQAKVKAGLAAEAIDDDEIDDIARENQILADSEVARLLLAARRVDEADGWEGDLYRLVLVLTATGARMSQVRRMRVGDCQVDAQRLMVPPSRKGRGAKAGSITVPVGPDVMAELRSIVVGRPADAPLLERWRHKQAPGGIEWEQDKRGPWQTASELTRPWKAIRDAAGLPDAIPYALRHTSIVRSIRANLPVRMVAALHDTSIAMIERHYARWITSGLEDLARAALRPLVPVAPNGENVVRLQR